MRFYISNLENINKRFIDVIKLFKIYLIYKCIATKFRNVNVLFDQ